MISGSRGWWIGCVLTAILAAGVPFLWRIEGGYVWALVAIGVVLIVGVATLMRGISLVRRERSLSPAKVLGGLVVLLAGVAFAVLGGPIARGVLFSMNYEKHLKLIGTLLSQHRTTRRAEDPLSKRAELEAKAMTEGGFQGGTVDYPEGNLRFTFQTPAGQGFEHVSFSLDRLEENERRRLLKQDDRGHWYLGF